MQAWSEATQHTVPTLQERTELSQVHALMVIAAQASPSSIEAQGKHIATPKYHELTGGC
jgi:hypothetical protein